MGRPKPFSGNKVIMSSQDESRGRFPLEAMRTGWRGEAFGRKENSGLLCQVRLSFLLGKVSKDGDTTFPPRPDSNADLIEFNSMKIIRKKKSTLMAYPL